MTNKGGSYLGSPPGVGGVRLDDPGSAVHRGHHHRIPVVVPQQLLDAAQHAALVHLQQRDTRRNRKYGRQTKKSASESAPYRPCWGSVTF